MGKECYSKTWFLCLTIIFLLIFSLTSTLSFSQQTDVYSYDEALEIMVSSGDIYGRLSFNGSLPASKFLLGVEGLKGKISKVNVWVVNGCQPLTSSRVGIPSLPEGVILEVKFKGEVDWKLARNVVKKFGDKFNVNFLNLPSYEDYLNIEEVDKGSLIFYAKLNDLGLCFNIFKDEFLPSLNVYGGFLSLLKPENYVNSSFTMFYAKFNIEKDSSVVEFVHLSKSPAKVTGEGYYAVNVEGVFGHSGSLTPSRYAKQSTVRFHLPALTVVNALIPNLEVDYDGKLSGLLEKGKTYRSIEVQYLPFTDFPQPNLTIVKFTNTTTWLSGKKVRVNIQVSNTGNAAAKNILIDDSLSFEAVKDYASVVEGKPVKNVDVLPPKSSESLTYTLEVKKTPTKPQSLKLPPTYIQYSDGSGLNIYRVYSNSFVVGLGCPVPSLLSSVWAGSLHGEPLKQEVATVYLLNLGELPASNVEVSFKNEVGEEVRKVLEIPPLNEVYLNFDFISSGLNLTYNLNSLTVIKYEGKVGMDRYTLNVEPSTYTMRFSKVRFIDFTFLRSLKSPYTVIGGLVNVNENLAVKGVFKPVSALLLNVLPENVSYVGGDFLVKNETLSVVFKSLEISQDGNLLFNYLLTLNNAGSFTLPPPLLIFHSSKPFVDYRVYLGDPSMLKCLNVRFVKTSSLRVFAGEPLTVTFKIQNREPKPLLNVKVSDSKPEQFKLVSGSLEFTIPSVDAGQELSRSYQLSADVLGRYTLPSASLTFTYDGVELNSASNQVSGLAVIPKLVITKSVDKTELNIGDTLNIQITVQNPTNLTFYGVSIFDPVITGFTIKSGSNMLKGLTINPGESKVLVYQVEAKMEGDFLLLPAYVTYNYGGEEVKVDSQIYTLKVGPSMMPLLVGSVVAVVALAIFVSYFFLLRERRGVKKVSKKEVEELPEEEFI
ncbi:MAG: hypothetical protein ACKD6N_07440 [Candidatus Bathyarchaeota archaeon]